MEKRTIRSAVVNGPLGTVGRALANSYLSPGGAYYKGSTIAAVSNIMPRFGSHLISAKIAAFL